MATVVREIHGSVRRALHTERELPPMRDDETASIAWHSGDADPVFRKQLRMKARCAGEAIEADVLVTREADHGWRSALSAELGDLILTHKTAWVCGEHEAIAHADAWLRSHLTEDVGMATVLLITRAR